MEKIFSGNTAESNPQQRGWMLGSFLDPNSPLHSDAVEIKWGVFKKGEDKTVAAANRVAKSISILVKGRVNLLFPDHDTIIELKKEGDYAYWENNVFHTSQILEDSVVITIRWPSITHDSYTK